MAFTTITLEKKDLLGLSTLNRPENLNTFRCPLALKLNEAPRQAEDANQGIAAFLQKAALGLVRNMALYYGQTN